MPDNIRKDATDISVSGMYYLVVGSQKVCHLDLVFTFIKLWVVKSNREGI